MEGGRLAPSRRTRQGECYRYADPPARNPGVALHLELILIAAWRADIFFGSMLLYPRIP